MIFVYNNDCKKKLKILLRDIKSTENIWLSDKIHSGMLLFLFSI